MLDNLENKKQNEVTAEPVEETAAEAAEALTEEKTEAPEAAGAEEAPVQEPEAEEEVKVYEPQEKKPPVPILTEEKNPELAPVTPDRSIITPAVQYSKSIERERKIAEEVKKRQRRPMIVILAMCVVLIVFAIILNAVMRDYAEPEKQPGEALPPAESSLPPVEQGQPQGGGIVVVDPPQTQPLTPSRYEIFQADVSWREARELCQQKGGHLAVISSQEEFDQVIALAEQQGADKLWLGCRRENDQLLWETGETVDFYPWAQGEPSGVDAYDGTAEDYLLLWNNGGWFYNDSRNHPVADYPEWYSGSIGYVCEYEG